jgi:glycosyltransferase involved in cell wall biosynthesis
MNILFISFDADPPNMGGTATIVHLLAKAFQAKRHFVALAYYEDSTYPSIFFEFKVKLSKDNRKNVESFFKFHQFDIIYNTQAMSTDFLFLKSLPLGNCKIVSAYHNKPLLRFFPLESLMNLFHESNSILYKIYTLTKIPLLPFWKYQSQRKERLKYQEMVSYSDKVQLLSDKFYPCFLKIVPGIDSNKLIAIENPVVFDTFYPIKELRNKKKKLVVVCTTNYQKRANLMIQIWERIEKDDRFNDWSFDFIGGGEGFNRIKRLASDAGLKRIDFLGFQNPEAYYKRCSIFMMTSRYEGWPMVLMEAMQMGVVPIVFNSFESLQDIINNNENGFIVDNNDMEGFVKKLKLLMENSEIRLLMAENAISSSTRFTIEIVLKKYLNIFEQLIEK